MPVEKNLNTPIKEKVPGQATPGPWTWFNYAGGRKILVADTCAVIHCPDSSMTVDAEDQRLIAAAPDLLEALKQTNDALRALVYSCETEGWIAQQALAIWRVAMAHNADLDTRVEAIIAKAEGR